MKNKNENTSKIFKWREVFALEIYFQIYLIFVMIPIPFSSHIKMVCFRYVDVYLCMRLWFCFFFFFFFIIFNFARVKIASIESEQNKVKIRLAKM